MPDVLGLHFSPKHRAKISRVKAGSSAEKDGFHRADEILTLAGQPIISIADVQWVLHRAPDFSIASSGLQTTPKATTLPVTVDRHGEEINPTMTLNPGWQKGSDISWRTTIGELWLVALGGMVLQDLSDAERQRNGIGENEMALSVETVSRRSRRSNTETNAQKAGIHRGDIITAYGERTDRLTESSIIGYVLQDTPQVKALPIKLLRNGEQIEVELSLE